MRLLFILTIATCLWSCKKFTPVENVSDNFVLSLFDTAGVKANGTNSIGLRLTSTDKVKEGLRVVFSSNKGTVLEADQPYVNNKAETRLQLTEDTGSYSIKATVKDGTTTRIEKYITVSFRAAYPQQEFNLEVFDSTGVRANGLSMISVRFTGSGSYKQGLTVHFETTKGTLLQTDMPFQNNSAQTKLTVSQDSGLYFLKGQLKDGSTVKLEKSIVFTIRRAYANAIQLELSTSKWAVNQQITIKTLLTRAEGKVTIGQPVFFRAYQFNSAGDPVDVGRFEGLLNNVSDANGRLTDFKLILDTPNLDTNKVVTLQAKALNDQGDTVRRTVVLPH